MKYWIKVILMCGMTCATCGRILDWGDIAYLLVEPTTAPYLPAKCPMCFAKEFPARVETPKL